MTNEKKAKKKKKKGYVPRPIGKGEMIDVGRTYGAIPTLLDFKKEVMRLSKADHIDASEVKISHGGIYKANVLMKYKGEYRAALFLLVKRTVMGNRVFQMTRMFVDKDDNEGDLFDLFEARDKGLKGIEFHIQW